MTLVVRTVLGDVPSDTLGLTYAHEHLYIDGPLIEQNWPHIWLNSVSDAVEELAACYGAGVRTVVDAMPAGSGGNINKLVEISRLSGINIVATTGVHTAKYYAADHWAITASTEELADRFTRSVACRDGDGALTGMVKVATSGVGLSQLETRQFTAAADTMAKTGVALLTHCEHGEGAVDQLSFLEELGVRLDRVIVSHTDKVADTGYHREILSSGANVEYDQSLRQADSPVPGSALLVAQMLEDGFGDQILFGTDGARRDLWTTHSGRPGLAWLAAGFVDHLRDLGVGVDQVATMLVRNPARVLALDPVV